MEIELLPTVSLLPETFSLLIAPVELLAKAQSSHLELQRYKILFISGNCWTRRGVRRLLCLVLSDITIGEAH